MIKEELARVKKFKVGDEVYRLTQNEAGGNFWRVDKGVIAQVSSKYYLLYSNDLDQFAVGVEEEDLYFSKEEVIKQLLNYFNLK